MKRYTVDDIMALRPCQEYSRHLVQELVGDGLTAREISKLDIPLHDRLWCLIHLLPDREQWLFACDCADRVLHLYEAEYPGDNRPRNAVNAARAYALDQSDENRERAEAACAAACAACAAAGDASGAALAAARAAAWDAAWAAAGDAAGAAGDAAGAAWDAAGDAQAAAWDAAGDELKWQVSHAVEMLEEETTNG